jgi:hypothetical protein
VVTMKIAPQFEKIPAADIAPKGWYRDILLLQAQGLTGAADKIFPDLSADSAWLAGKGEAWERGPYYFDGLAPLSFLTKDDKLSKKRKQWLEAILRSQRENGDFGPERNPDWWPRMVVIKTLARYNESEPDERIIPFMLKYLRFQYENIDKHPPYFWAKARALEAFEGIEYVYRKTGEAFLPKLIGKLSSYMYDWTAIFKDYPYKKPMTAYASKALFKTGKFLLEPLDKISKASQKIKKPPTKERAERFNNRKLVKTIMLTHGVNLSMALKYPAAIAMTTGDKELFALPKAAYFQLMSLHGTAAGLFTSDEHVMGSNPSQGIELCTVAEAMYSFQELLRITGDVFYADISEFLFYNALPATFTDDMCAHQYVQQVNQIRADKRPRQFFDTDGEANIFGIEPNYGCCMANLHQGFTKIAECFALRQPGSITFMVYAPFELNGKGVNIEAAGDYPFGDSMRYVIKADTDISLRFRIPDYTQVSFLLNGKPVQPDIRDKFALIKGGFKAGDVISLEFDQKIAVIDNPDGSISIRRGSLLLAMPLIGKEIFVRGERPFHYRGYVSDEDWRAAPLLTNGKPVITSMKLNGIDSKPFNTLRPALEVTAQGVSVDWKERSGSADSVPEYPVAGKEREIKLVPYGGAKLRIAQFPRVEK